ncbi:MAG: PucR family transcriptional regulator [Clostridiales Family XIII bacterium]|nr:PucR family transcriptional regulator [Clostridiales Family XIII bacterium]
MLTGDGGLNNEVRVISFIDAPTSIEWLKGKEIILTTAFLYQEDEQALYQFIQNLINKNVAAVAIKLGRYIKTVPDSIRALAERNNFPIISIPYEMVWSEVIDRFYALTGSYKGMDLMLDGSLSFLQNQMKINKGDNKILRKLFVDHLTVAAAIVDDEYHIYAMNNRGASERIKLYCAMMTQEKTHNSTNRVELKRQKEYYVGEILLSSGERLIVASDTKLLNRYEIEKLCTIYNSLHKRNWLRSNADVLQQYLIEGIVSNSMVTDLREFSHYLAFNDNNYFMFFSISGAGADAVCETLRNLLMNNRDLQKVILKSLRLELQGRDKVFGFVSVRTQEASPSEFDICLRKMIHGIDLGDADYTIYCGKGVNKIELLQTGYVQASKAEQYSKILSLTGKAIFYNDFIFIDKLLGEKLDFKVIEGLKRTFTSFDAVQTLEAFLEYKSLHLAAAACFIHENTMRYRIGKIKASLGYDFSNPITCLHLLEHIKLWRIVRAESGQPSAT